LKKKIAKEYIRRTLQKKELFFLQEYFAVHRSFPQAKTDGNSIKSVNNCFPEIALRGSKFLCGVVSE
jgi:hypothetical protein